MVDVRINGKRMPILKAVGDLKALVMRLEAIGNKEGTELTSLVINGRSVDLDNPDILKLRLDADDTVEARMESAGQLALQSLQVAQEMAELLVFDLKVATLNLWDNTRTQTKNLETLINDCNLFLSLAARPMDLLGQDPLSVEKPVEECLRKLDEVANNLEDAVLLAAHDRGRAASHVLVARVMPAIEKWLSLSSIFAEHLSLGQEQLVLPSSAANISHLALQS